MGGSPGGPCGRFCGFLPLRLAILDAELAERADGVVEVESVE